MLVVAHNHVLCLFHFGAVQVVLSGRVLASMRAVFCLCVHFVACRNASSQRFRLPMMVRVWRPLTFLATTCTLQHAKTDWDLEKLPRVKGMVEAHTRAGPKDCQVRLWRWRPRWWLWRWWLWRCFTVCLLLCLLRIPLGNERHSWGVMRR